MTPIAKASKSLQPHCHWMPVYLLSSPNCKQRAASTSPFVESIYSNTIIYIQFLAFPLVYDDIIVTYYLMCTRAVIVCALILGRKYRKYSLPLQTPHWYHKMQGPHNLIAIHRSENTTGIQFWVTLAGTMLLWIHQQAWSDACEPLTWIILQ